MALTDMGRVRPGRRDFRRNPAFCILLTAAATATFWLGLIWLATRIAG